MAFTADGNKVKGFVTPTNPGKAKITKAVCGVGVCGAAIVGKG